jgi:hypothetical protein
LDLQLGPARLVNAIVYAGTPLHRHSMGKRTTADTGRGSPRLVVVVLVIVIVGVVVVAAAAAAVSWAPRYASARRCSSMRRSARLFEGSFDILLACPASW